MAYNSGTTGAYPVIKVTGPGRWYHLINHTTGEEIHFDLTLQADEVATLNLKDKTFVSTFRGDEIFESIIEGSDLNTWHLQPGENNVSIFIDDPDAEAFMIWDELHWSVDGGAVDV